MRLINFKNLNHKHSFGFCLPNTNIPKMYLSRFPISQSTALPIPITHPQPNNSNPTTSIKPTIIQKSTTQTHYLKRNKNRSRLRFNNLLLRLDINTRFAILENILIRRVNKSDNSYTNRTTPDVYLV